MKAGLGLYVEHDMAMETQMDRSCVSTRWISARNFRKNL